MHTFYKEEQEAREEGREVVKWFCKVHGFSALPDREKKEDPYKEACGDLPSQSLVYEYGASDSEDEPYSDDERGPSVVHQPPMAEANVVNEDVSGDSEDSDDECRGSHQSSREV